MSAGAHLWAVGFDNMEQAEQVRNVVAQLGERGQLILLDTAVALRYPDGCVTLDGEPFVSVPYSPGRSLADFLASLALGAPPLTGGAAGTLVRSVSGSAAEVGIDEGFIREVQALMKPGTSVLFVLDQEGDMPAILRGLSGRGGTVLKSNVDVTRAKLIQSTLSGDDDEAKKGPS
jgi:uncharacterized membrane protein